MKLFSNNNYFLYIIAIICILFVSQTYYNNCKKNIFSRLISFSCILLFILSLLVIIYMILQSIKYTNDENNKLTYNEYMTRNIIDYSMLIIISFILLFTLYMTNNKKTYNNSIINFY